MYYYTIGKAFPLAKMKHLEIEYKTLLTKAEYLQLQKEFSDVIPHEQTNYYIDTPNFEIKGNRMSLRIRTLSDKAELTLKVPQEVGNMEYNQDLDLKTAHALLTDFQLPTGAIFDVLHSHSNIPLEKLQIWGSLTTKRREKETSLGLMALDLNHYADKEDYELEVEVSDAQEGKQAFDFFLKKHKIKFKYASSKVARLAKLIQSVQ